MFTRIRRAAAVILVFCMLAAFVPGSADAAAPKEEPSASVRIYYNGLFSGMACYYGSTLYLPVENLCTFMGVGVQVMGDSASGTYTVVGDNFVITSTAGNYYTVANHRYFYSPEEYLFIGETLYISLPIMQKVFNITSVLADDMQRVDIDLGSFSVIKGGVSYYEDRYSADDITWLCRIIYSEAHTESLEGAIGVGNVVLNRVASNKYPNTIYDVVFDKEFGFQFSPTLDGSVYFEPDERSTAAAYMCLEGYNTVGNSLYFVNPFAADDTWFKTMRTFYKRIGNHDFYL